jgi:hypothetical protein
MAVVKNEPWISIKGGECLDYVDSCYLIKDFDPCSWLNLLITVGTDYLFGPMNSSAEEL